MLSNLFSSLVERFTFITSPAAKIELAFFMLGHQGVLCPAQKKKGGEDALSFSAVRGACQNGDGQAVVEFRLAIMCFMTRHESKN